MIDFCRGFRYNDTRSTEREDEMVSASKTIETIIDDRGISKKDFATNIGITNQNFSNKLKRDSFSAKELAEIGVKTGMKLVFIDETNLKELIQSGAVDKIYPIEYADDELFNAKRNEEKKTPEERKAIANRSAATKKMNKQIKEDNDSGQE